MPARMSFRQQLDQFGLQLEGLEVDEVGTDLARQSLRNALLGDIAAVDQQPAELATGTLLLFEREFELLAGNEVLLHQHVTKANFFRACHQAISNAALESGPLQL